METIKEFALGQWAQKSLGLRRTQHTQTRWPEAMEASGTSASDAAEQTGPLKIKPVQGTTW